MAIIFIALFVFTVTQKLYIPEHIRPFTLLAAVIGGLLIFFAIVKPSSPYQLSRFLSFWFSLIVAVVIVILHIVIYHDLSYKSVIVLTVTVASPFIVGCLYKKKWRMN
jgi:hypothetical protein